MKEGERLEDGKEQENKNCAGPDGAFRGEQRSVQAGDRGDGKSGGRSESGASLSAGAVLLRVFYQTGRAFAGSSSGRSRGLSDRRDSQKIWDLHYFRISGTGWRQDLQFLCGCKEHWRADWKREEGKPVEERKEAVFRGK